MADPFPRFWPNNETIDPGERGELEAKLAPFTAALRMGATEDAPNPPVTWRVPVSVRVASVAVTLSVTAPVLLPDCQVLCQVPPWMEIKFSGGSPFENVATTSPALSGLPQSSATCASSTTGHAAGTPKDWPKVVMAGTSCVGAQLVAARARAAGRCQLAE